MVAARGLPVSTSTLVGRGAEVAALLSALGVERLVTVTGPPGVGKTRLALAVAEAARAEYADVVWVDLSSLRDPGLLVAEIGQAAGVRSAAALADAEVLVVLDNCEHLLAAAPELADLLATSTGITVLATSRERWRLRAETEFPLSALPMPDADGATDLEALAGNPAVALVLQRSPAYLTLTPRTAQPLVDICRRLDGLPLALEFAAARLRVFTPGELAFRLQGGAGELAGGDRDAPERHRDLRAAIAWSHDLLPAAERAVFRRLSVFESGWTVVEAEAVCGPDVPDALAALESLLDKNLIRRAEAREDQLARFTMLVSLREYAAEQLDEHGEAAATRRRHALWFAEVARSWEATIGTGEENMTWDRSGMIRGDLECALAEVQGSEAEPSLWLRAALSWFWYTRGSPVHGAGLGPPDEELREGSAMARAAALVATGAVSFALGRLAEADRSLVAAYALCEATGDRRRAAFSSAFLGHLERERGHPDEAVAHYERARSTYAMLGSERGVAWALCDLGLLAAERGDLARADGLVRQALLLFDELDYPWAAAVASCGLAGVCVAGGDADQASTWALRAFRGHTDVGDVRGVAQSLETLAEVALARGAVATAGRLLGAGGARRDRVAAHVTRAEQARIDRVATAVSQRLGVDGSTREQRAGRTLTAGAVTALVERVVEVAGPAGEAAPAPALTGRQREVAALVAAGHTNRQIARELGISEKTTELHLHHAMRRLGVPNRAGVAAWIAAQPP